MLTTTLVEVDVRVGFGFLSSAIDGRTEQQITRYPHRDDNNLWRVLNATVDSYDQYDYEHKPIVYIEHGSRITLGIS